MKHPNRQTSPPHKAPVEVIWAPGAIDDVEAIISYIAEDNEVAAASVLSAIRERAASLNRFSSRGSIVDELDRQGITGYRQLVEGPWRIIYRIDGAVVRVVAVIDGRRDIWHVLQDCLLRDRLRD